MSGGNRRSVAARRRAREAVTDLVNELLAGCDRDARQQTEALAALTGGVGGLTVEQLADFCDAVDYDLLLTAQPKEQANGALPVAAPLIPPDPS